MMVSGKRHKVTALRTESQFHGVFQQKADMEIAEIGPDCIKSKDASLTPFEQSLLRVWTTAEFSPNLVV